MALLLLLSSRASEKFKPSKNCNHTEISRTERKQPQQCQQSEMMGELVILSQGPNYHAGVQAGEQQLLTLKALRTAMSILCENRS